MAHFLAEHGEDFRWRAAVEQIIGQRDARGAQEARHIGRNSRGLLRSVEGVNVVGRNAIGARHGHNGGPQAALRQLRVMVEQRRDVHGRNHQHDHHERDRDSGAPHPPAALGCARGGIDDRQQDRESEQAHQEAFPEIAAPLQECLVRQPVGVFAHEAFVDRQRQAGQCRRHDVLRDIDRNLQETEARNPRGEVAHPGRQPQPQEQPGNDERVEHVDDGKNVAALEVGVGARLRLAADSGEVGVHRLVRIEIHYAGGG